jgi:hypothetical protein
VTGDIRYSVQLISTVAGGTVPVAVTSTTLCTNLNADMLDDLHLTDITAGTFGGLSNPCTLKRFMVMQCDGTNSTARGLNTTMAVTGMTLAVASDTVTTWTSHRCAANACGYAYRATSLGCVRLDHNPTMIWHIKTHSDITNIKLWFLLTKTAIGTVTDDPAGAYEYAAFRFSTTVGANWYYVTRDGANTNAVDSGLAVAADTVYTLKMVGDVVAGTVTFTINGGSSQTINANLPVSSTELLWEFCVMSSSVSVQKYVLFGAMYTEWDIA